MKWIWKEDVIALFEALLQHLPKKTQGKPQMTLVRISNRWNLNPQPPLYKGVPIA